jgi:ABC-2 type transport system permease protein
MIKLLRLEFRKILTYKIFWAIIGLYFFFLGSGIALAELIINAMVNDMNKNIPIPLPHVTIYLFPAIWQNVTFFASLRYILVLPAIIIIILITNEFSNKTIRQNVACGLSRNEFLVSKLLVILTISVAITLVLSLLIFILGITHSEVSGAGQVFTNFSFIPGFFILSLTFLAISFFFGFIFRNTGLAIALFVLYVFIIEPILSMASKIPKLHISGLSRFLPVNASLNIVEYPHIPVLKTIMGLNITDHVSLAVCLVPAIYAILFVSVVFLVVNRKAL